MYQPQSSLQNRTIVLSDVQNSQDGNQVIISDEQGNKYSFFKTKKSDGQSTQAFKDLEGFGPGSQVEVAFEERPGKNGGRSFNNVARIRPVGVEKPVQSAAPRREVYPTAPRTVSQDRPSPSHTVIGGPFSKDKMIGVLALMKVAMPSLEDLEKAETWERFGNAYDTGKVVLSDTAPVTPPSGNDIQVEDIPY